eukprot:TRINITY_DN9151_c0_g1_i2.p1 TRINITY_DN9151_c0_g1~~TRINITY_DN9151_c0_g1_i2.p1  ORF type:complete len:247 (+),score=32.29 TRINITY_DN9151_c0_g1_i2:126-866(+)
MIRRPPRSTLSSSSAASDVYKRQRYSLCTLLISTMVPRHLLQLVMIALVVAVPRVSYAATSVFGTVVFVQTSYSLTGSQLGSFIDVFRTSNAQNSISGITVSFTSMSRTTSAMTTLRREYPSVSAVQIGSSIVVSGLAGFDVNDLTAMMTFVYLGGGSANDMTLTYGSESDAKVMVSLINSDLIKGMTGAWGDVADDGAPVGAIVGGIFGAIAGVLLIVASAALIYWKYFKSSGREVQDDTDEALL